MMIWKIKYMYYLLTYRPYFLRMLPHTLEIVDMAYKEWGHLMNAEEAFKKDFIS